MSKPTLGFVGLGYMGRPMCANLLKAGYQVTVWNRSRAGMTFAVSHGAVEANSARARGSGIGYCRDDGEARRRYGRGGARAQRTVRAGHKGMILIDMSTIASVSGRLDRVQTGESGVLMLDAPVSGSTPRAEAGTLSIMVGGPREAFERGTARAEDHGKQHRSCRRGERRPARARSCATRCWSW